jgi:hypothetical protein
MKPRSVLESTWNMATSPLAAKVSGLCLASGFPQSLQAAGNDNFLPHSFANYPVILRCSTWSSILFGLEQDYKNNPKELDQHYGCSIGSKLWMFNWIKIMDVQLDQHYGCSVGSTL